MKAHITNKTLRFILAVILICVFFTHDTALLTTLTASADDSQSDASGVFELKKINSEDLRHIFSIQSAAYNPDLAELSARAAMLAYESYSRKDETTDEYEIKKNTEQPDSLVKMLKSLEFGEVTTHGYGVNKTNPHGISYALAHRNIKIGSIEYTLIAVIFRGTNGVEWRGNFDIYKDKKTPSDDHYSFFTAMNTAYDELLKYMKANNLDKSKQNVKLWITGHSRGGAVANLLGAFLNNGGGTVASRNNIYTYTFATPNVTSKDTGKMNNIFNFVIEEDFIPDLPLEIYGYKKYGVTHSGNAGTAAKQNGEFKNNIESVLGSAVFDYLSRTDFVNTLKGLASDINTYYNKKYKSSGGLYTPYEYLRQCIAGAVIVTEGGSYIETLNAAVLIADASGSYIGKYANDYSLLAKQLLWGGTVSKWIDNSHQAYTYYQYVKYFNKYIYDPKAGL